jgi:hypothetical protein
MSHVWTIEAWHMVKEAPCREGHASSLNVTGDLVLPLLIVVKIPVLPLCTESLLLEIFRVMGSGLLLAIMPWVM